MSSQELARVGLKLLGVFWLVSALIMMAVTVPLMLSAPDRESISGGHGSPFLIQYLMIGVLLVSAVVLLIGTDFVLKVFFKQAEAASEPLNTETFQAIAFSLLGAWLFTHGLSMMGSFTATAAFSKLGAESLGQRYVAEGVATLAQAVVQALTGIWLFFNGRGISRRWHGRHRI